MEARDGEIRLEREYANEAVAAERKRLSQERMWKSRSVQLDVE